MKKIYALAMAAFATMAMNAQIYVVGEFDGAAHWTPEDPAAIGTLNEAGNWEVTIHNCAGFKISTVKGNWDAFNEKAFSINSGDITKEFINDFFAVEAWGENTNLPWIGDWTIEVTADYTKMKLTTTTPEPTEAVPAYVIGNFTLNEAGENWKFNESWKMTSPELFKYTFHCQGESMIAAGEEFKLAAQGWTQINYTVGGEALADGETTTDVPYNNGANMFFTEDFEGDILLELVNGYNKPANITFTPIEAGIENVAVANDAKAEYFNLQGVRVANPEQGGLYIVRRGNEVSKVIVK